jgi:hypothetical protein
MELSHLYLSFSLDVIPVVLAIVALQRLYTLDKMTTTLQLARASCIMLVLCQLTWIHSYLMHFPLINSLVDNIWAIFNSIVMIMILSIVKQNRVESDRG